MPPLNPPNTVSTNLAELEGDGTLSAEFISRMQSAANGLDGLAALEIVKNDLEKFVQRTATLAMLLDRGLSQAPTQPQHLIEHVAKIHQLYLGTAHSPDGEPSVGSIHWLMNEVAKLYHSDQAPPSAKLYQFSGSKKLH